MTTPGPDKAPPLHAASDRRAPWIELFFDLVAVAGISQLTHLLGHELSLSRFGQYLVLYAAFWTVWASIVVYGNVAETRLRVAVVLGAMVGLGIMAAAVAEIGEHANTFAITFITVRLLASKVWQPGHYVIDWPATQLLGGLTPWIASLWAPESLRYWLWTIGLALDLGVAIGFRGETLIAQLQEKLDHRLRRAEARSARRPPQSERQRRGHARTVAEMDVVAERIDPHYLSERLGLFVIIVLGEGVIALIADAADVHWGWELTVGALAGFAMLTSLWGLALVFGDSGLPGRSTDTSPSTTLALHLFASASIAVIAAGLGNILVNATEHAHAGERWLLGGGLAAYFLLAALERSVGSRRWSALWSWPLPFAAAAIGLTALGATMAKVWFICLLAALTVAAVVAQASSAARPASVHSDAT